jgi:hypothetical protein
VITGFNTDIEHDGVVYHVQTEDKGLDSPIILSLVYTGGTILASKRSPYEDLIAEGFSDEALAEPLKRQHRLICAAIHSGRIDDLRKMSRKGAATVEETSTKTEAGEELAESVEASPVSEEPFEIEYGPLTQEWTPPPLAEEFDMNMEQGWEPVEEPDVPVEPPPVEEPEPEPEPIKEPIKEPIEEPAADGLVIAMLDDAEFYSGESHTLRVRVSNRVNGKDSPLGNVAVSVKILGTTFRPLIYSLKTGSDGVATVATKIPEFNSGRAAVLVRAVAKDQAAELRCIIHPAK